MDPATLRTRAEFGAGLNALRESAGFTVRELAKEIGRPPGTLGDYLRGRHVPSPAQQSLIVDLLLACGVTAPADVEAWLAALRRVRASSDRRTTRSAAPYRGLEPFEPEDAALFFGRRDQTDEIVRLVARLRTERGPSRGVLAVIGPSGSGKSSLLRAGVVAAVRAGVLDTEAGDGRWTCAVTTPGDDPVAALTTALAGRRAGPHLVVLDQFEEIFTLTADEDARAAFLDTLVDVVPDVVVALGMRADFFAEAAREPVLLAALRHAQVVVGPLSAEQLRDVVVGPANHIGVSVEDGLVEVVLADLGPHHAGALPLLSHALLATWDRSSGRALTVADYRATGGLDAAVQRTAEEVFTALDAHRQEAAHDLFVRLVNVGDDTAPTRRRISRAELGLDGPDGARAEVREVVDRFAERRLLTLTEDSVEVSHEALLIAWPRLRGWLDSDRAGLLVHRRITTGANTWEAAGRDPVVLPAGAALETAVEWSTAPRNQRRLNPLELAYLAAGVGRRDELAHAERRRTRRLTQLLVAVAVLALVATGLAALARLAQDSASHARRVAAAARDDALSRQVAIQARELSASDPGLAQQLAVAGYRISPTLESRSELIDATAAPITTRILGSAGPTPLGVSDTGLVAVGHADDGSVHLYGRTDGRLVARGALPGVHRQLFALAFAPGGQVLATGGQPRDVTLWDVHDPAHPQVLARLATGFADALQSLTFSPDGARLLAAGDGPHPLHEWAVTDLTRVVTVSAPSGLPPSTTVQSAAFDASGTSIAAVTVAGGVFDWSTSRPSSPRQATIARTGRVRLDAVTFDPRTGQLVTGGNGGQVVIWNTGGPRLSVARVLPGNSNAEVNVLSFAADGTQLLSGSSDGSVRRWAAAGWTLLATIPNPGPVTGVAFAPDRSAALAVSADGTLRSWSTNAPQVRVGSGAVFAAQFDAAGGLLAVAQNGIGGGVQLWDAHDPRALRTIGSLLTMTGARSAIDGSTAVSGNGRLLAAGNSNGQVELWDVRDPDRPVRGTLFAPSDDRIENVSLNQDGSLLAVGGDDDAVSLWSVRDPAHPVRLGVVRAGDLILDVVLSTDGRLLAAGSADQTARLWDISDPTHPRPEAVLRGFGGYVFGVAFAPGGHLLATTSADHTTRLWSLADPQRPTRVGPVLRGPSDYAEVPSFDAAGHLLAVPSNDHTVWVYDVTHPAHARALATLRAVQGNVFVATFAPHGEYLVGGGRDTQAPLWTIDPDADAALVCAGAGDPITRTEWRQYVPGAAYDPPCR